MASKWQEQKRSVAETARKMAEFGLVVGTAGNVSVRLDPEEERELMAVTPSATSYESLTLDDIVVTDFEIEPVEGGLPPSSESLLHVGIYQRRPDVEAVVHTHSVYSSVLAVSGVELPPVIDELIIYVGGAVKVSKYGFPGTSDLADNTCEALGDNKAAFIANHGAVTVGKTLEEALSVCLLVERACQIYIMARGLGHVVPIAPEFVAVQKAIYRMKNLHDGASDPW